MKRSNKIMVAVLAIVGVSALGTAVVSARGPGNCGYAFNDGYAPMQPRFNHGRMGQGPGMGMNFMDRSVRMEQNLALFKTQLKITPDQESAWDNFITTMKTKQQTRLQTRQMRMQGNLGVKERATLMREGAEQMISVADAMEQLYAVLTPEQQAIADLHRPMGMHRGF